jgi:hypothetical protein
VEQSGEHRIAASREAVWAALNDPEVLCRCLDGCQSMERVGDDRFDAKVKAKVGPVSAVFQARIELQDVQPLESYTLEGNVKGGAAGFARGSARVDLSDAEGGTLLRYGMKASVGGKLAQVGSRLIDGTARKMTEDFFAAFARELGAPAAPPGEEAPAGEEARAGEAEAEPGAARRAHEAAKARRAASGGYETRGAWKIWLVVFIALILALLFAL